MKENIQRVSTHDLFPVIKELLACNKQAIFTVSGISMLPFIGNRRDQVLISTRDFTNLKKGDIVLFQYDSGVYILHRIYKITQHGYITMGDGNLHYDDEIRYDQIIGVVDKIYRKNKEIDINNNLFKFVSNIWMIAAPIRKYTLGAYKWLSIIKNKLIRFRNEL